MKITVLGRGNAGCLTALHFSYYSRFYKDKNIEVELIHDSKIPTLTVGQATTLILPPLIWEALGTDYFTNSIDLDYTMKTGIMYEGWGKKQEKIFHPFELGKYALHYDTQKFQSHILKHADFKVTVVDKYVENYDELDGDYIIDCRGWPKDFENNYNNLINPLNAVVCSNIPRKEKEVDWTRACATPDGWSFYIPLHDNVSIGYMYNSDITTKDEAINNFKNQFGVDNIREGFPFKQYIAKKPIDGRVIKNGNMLFFLEPLESTSVHTYIHWCRGIWDTIVENKFNEDTANLIIQDHVKKVQNFILWHYMNGSKYETKFWSHAKELSENHQYDNQFFDYLNYSQRTPMNMIRNTDYDRNNELYAQWIPWSFKVWHDGVV